jgi:cytochrome c-type biogenesis protein CcmH
MRQPLAFVSLILITLLTGFSLAQSEDSALKAEAREIENLIIAPCCWRQPVSIHPSPASDEIKKDIRAMLTDGLGREEILDKYVAQYGERILAKPPSRGFGRLAYLLPLIFLVAGAAVALLVMRRLRAGQPVGETSRKRQRVSSKYSAQLEKELWG